VHEKLTICLGKKLARALNIEAEQTGLTKSDIARQAIKWRLRRKLFVMNKYFGTVSGPPDLSTNKQYYRLSL